MSNANDTGLLDRPARARRRSARITSLAEAMAEAFGDDRAPVPQQGTFRWELNTDQLCFSDDATSILSEALEEIPAAAPDFIGRMRSPDAMELMTALVHTMRHGGAMSVHFTLDGPAGAVRLQLRGRRLGANSPLLVGLLVRVE